MGRKARKKSLTEKVVEAGDQALPRIEAARDALLAELAPHAASAGRKARKHFAAATALADASVEVARHALAPPPPKPRRRGRKLVFLLALGGIGALVFKNLRPSAEPTAYQPPASPPPAAEKPVPPVVEEPVVEADAPAEPVTDEPVDVAPAEEPAPEAPTESLTSFFDQVLSETEAAKKKPAKKQG